MRFEDFLMLSPEILLATMACIILIADCYTKDSKHSLTYMMSQLAVLGSIVLLVGQINIPAQFLYDGHLQLDRLSVFLKIGAAASVSLIFLYGRAYATEHGMAKGEHYVLVLFVLLGMFLMSSAASLLMVYLGLELFSLPLYALIAMQSTHRLSSEGAMKYFVMGGVASGFLLYGISLVYGLTGTIDLNLIMHVMPTDSMAAIFALIFIVTGVAFKFGAVPFHMWMPDVYESSPTEITILVASAPKLAAFGMMYRLLIDTLPGMYIVWSDLLMVLALLSIIFGNIAALAQTNFKRMMAYSTMSHVGFIFLGFIAASTTGFAPALFYDVIYVILTLAVFGVLLALSHIGFDLEEIEGLKGLHHKRPLMAFFMLILMFSFAGVPPTAGFYAKFIVLQSLVDAGYIMPAIVAILASVIAAFYYLRIVRMMYFEQPNTAEITVSGSVIAKLGLSVNALAALMLGLLPAGLYSLCLWVFA